MGDFNDPLSHPFRRAIEKLTPAHQASSSASSLVSLASGDISLVLLRSIEPVVIRRAENQTILDVVLSLVEQENVFKIQAFKGGLLREVAAFISDWKPSPESQRRVTMVTPEATNIENGQIEGGIHAQRGFRERHKRRATTVTPEVTAIRYTN